MIFGGKQPRIDHTSLIPGGLGKNKRYSTQNTCERGKRLLYQQGGNGSDEINETCGTRICSGIVGEDEQHSVGVGFHFSSMAGYLLVPTYM